MLGKKSIISPLYCSIFWRKIYFSQFITKSQKNVNKVETFNACSTGGKGIITNMVEVKVNVSVYLVGIGVFGTVITI